jgi:hypothetical protein
MQLLTFARRFRVGMNKLISTGNERVIDATEFIACLEGRRPSSFMRRSAYRRCFGSSRPVD